MTSLMLYNTLSGKKEPFEPSESGQISLYSCGPTVYDYIHIGNARPFIVFDALRNYLEQVKGYRVIYAQNITDVDDKIINRALTEGKSTQEIAKRYTDAFFKDLERLGVRRADRHPQATAYIEPMIEFIETLIESGYAYEVDGDVYYRVRRFAGYGKLSGRSIDELESGARVAVDERKEDPLDFALWKRAKPNEPSWESPWGPGRPGWHTECAVMAIDLFRKGPDIHTGGSDLIFPHHENEIAQAEAKTGKPFAHYWLHNALLDYQGEKMSKSLGNFEYAREVVARYGRDPVRFFFLSKHYRTPINFTETGVAEAERSVRRVYNLLEEIELDLSRREYTAVDVKPEGEGLSETGQRFTAYLNEVRDRFIAALDDDFNTAGALGIVFELVREVHRFRSDEMTDRDLPLLAQTAAVLRELGEPLGLFQEKRFGGEIGLPDQLIELLIDVRAVLRDNQQWELADRIRDRLGELGVTLKDRADGTDWGFEPSTQTQHSDAG
ncbi:MAG: cysteine--tRNA ligase [Candidatus Bipolaricaulia bacterium]